jgi:hypothetical protein
MASMTTRLMDIVCGGGLDTTTAALLFDVA